MGSEYTFENNDKVWRPLMPGKTIRQEILDLLTEESMDVRAISGALGVEEKEIIDHLGHIQKTVARQKKKLRIEPSECLSCGFRFTDRRRFTRPGRCPRCRSGQITYPAYRIQ